MQHAKQNKIENKIENDFKYLQFKLNKNQTQQQKLSRTPLINLFDLF